jgi:CheY-like chemotaxis protein
MTRFGDFTLLEDLGRSAVADRYRAMHATQGGPFFLKIYSRLDTAMHRDLLARCEALIGQTHPHLAQHLGHSVLDGMPFVVSPFLEGVDLAELATSLKDRRVVLGMDAAVLLLADLSDAVAGLHARGPGNAMSHGEVSLRHVRVSADGQVWLTGLTTPRGDAPGRPPETRWDLAGVGALIYDLVPILRSGGGREPLPVPLDRVVRRALGIGPSEDHLTPLDLEERLHEVARTLELRLDRGAFSELVRRTVRAIERRLAESGKVAAETPAARGLPSDHIPSLEPVDLIPTLEPLPVPELAPVRPTPARPIAAPVAAPRPAIAPIAPVAAAPPVPWAAPTAMPELIPIPTVERPAVLAREVEATTRLVERAPAPRPPAPAAPIHAAPIHAAPIHAAPIHAAPIHAAPAPMRASEAPSHARPGAPVTPARPAPSPPAPAPREPAGAPTPAMGVPSPRPTPRPPGGAPPPAPPPLARPSAPATSGAPPAPPPLAKRAPARRPLLADPDEPAPARPVAAHRAETTRDSTDPEQRSARSEQLRRDPAITALLERGVIDERALDAAIHEHLQRGGRVLEILVSQNATTDAAIADTLAAAARAARITDQGLKARRPSPLLARRMPQTYLLARRVLPLSLDGDKLSLAVADPFDSTTVEELKGLLGAKHVELFVGARASVTASTVEVYRALSGAIAESDTPTILVCTPDEATATRIGGRLVQEGMRVEHVVDGRAAEEILRVRTPATVLCAHNLPTRNAQELLFLVREQPRTAELPFFVLGPRDDSLATRMLDLGADDYFGEPLRLEVVLAKVRRAAGKGANRSSSDGSPINDRSGIFSTVPTTVPAAPSQGTNPPFAPPPLTTPPPGSLAAVTTVPAAAPAVATTAPSFLDALDVGGLDDLPELPPDFVDDDTLQPGAPSMPTGVMGTLRQMPVPEIVQSLEMGRKTARVDLVPAEGDKGTIAFEGGALRFAECGALQGAEAFYQLVRHKEGFFRIHYGDKPPAVNIDAPTTFLLLEAMRLMDEEGQNLKK